jgi:hypothetical protein
LSKIKILYFFSNKIDIPFQLVKHYWLLKMHFIYIPTYVHTNLCMYVLKSLIMLNENYCITSFAVKVRAMLVNLNLKSSKTDHSANQRRNILAASILFKYTFDFAESCLCCLCHNSKRFCCQVLCTYVHLVSFKKVWFITSGLGNMAQSNSLQYYEFYSCDKTVCSKKIR